MDSNVPSSAPAAKSNFRRVGFALLEVAYAALLYLVHSTATTLVLREPDLVSSLYRFSCGILIVAPIVWIANAYFRIRQEREPAKPKEKRGFLGWSGLNLLLFMWVCKPMEFSNGGVPFVLYIDPLTYFHRYCQLFRAF